MNTRILQIVEAHAEIRFIPRTIVLYDPGTKVQSTHSCHYSYHLSSLLFNKWVPGTYWGFEFTKGLITHIRKLNGLETFNLRRTLDE